MLATAIKLFGEIDRIGVRTSGLTKFEDAVRPVKQWLGEAETLISTSEGDL